MDQPTASERRSRRWARRFVRIAAVAGIGYVIGLVAYRAETDTRPYVGNRWGDPDDARQPQPRPAQEPAGVPTDDEREDQRVR